MAQESRLAVTIDSRGAQRDAASMRKELESLESSGNRVAPAMDKAGASIESAGRRSDASSRKVGGLAAETDKLLGVVGGLAAPFAAAFSEVIKAALERPFHGVNLTAACSRLTAQWLCAAPTRQRHTAAHTRPRQGRSGR